nr:EOG090X0318 [Leptodora kindtii]
MAGAINLSENLLRAPANRLSGMWNVTLDPEANVLLSWKPIYEKDYLLIQVRIENLAPQSWFAVGFSEDGHWTESNVCVAWEDWKGYLHVQEAHVDQTGGLQADAKDNCQKASFERDGKTALLSFTRSFETTDPTDYVVEDGTTHVVYAYGTGPLYRIKGVKPADRDYGFQRVRLLKPEQSSHPPPKDNRFLLISTDKVRVPGVETTYWCNVFRIPEHFTHKHHVFQFEAAIDKGHESLVHHMEVFHCEAPANQIIPDYRGDCNSPQRPPETHVCKRVLAAWAFGAEPFAYPQEAGLPIGGIDFNPFVMLEVHYNNPTLRGDWVDSSGLRLWYTKQLRKYDAGVMEIGLEYTDKMAIPPGQKSFTLTGYCIAQCTAVGLPREGIHIFGSQLHTHLLGSRVVTQHFRNGHQLKELDRDNHYSTHFQEIRLLQTPVFLLPGDALVTTCWYDSTSRDNITLGGFSISDEMCVNYIHYFPRIDLEVCKSSISTDALQKYFKFMNKLENQPTSNKKGVSDNYKSIEWTPLRVNTLQDVYTMTPISMQCNRSSGERFPGDWDGIKPLTATLPVANGHRNKLVRCNHERSLDNN